MRPVNWNSPINWQHPLNRGLAGWWLPTPNHRGGTVLRDLTGRNHGTLTTMDPASDWVVPNRRGSWGALDFDGVSDRVALGADPLIRDIPLGKWSLWLLLKRTDLDSDKAIFSWQGADDLVIYPNDDGVATGGVRVFWRDMGGSVINEAGIDYTNIWQNLCFAWDGDKLRLYRDGLIAVTSASLTGTEGPFTDVWLNSFGGTGQWAAAQIANCALWNRTLSPAEVARYDRLSQQYFPGVLNRVVRRALVAPAASTASPWYQFAQEAAGAA